MFRSVFCRPIIYFLFVCQEQRRQYNCQMEEATQAEAAMVNV